MALHCSMQGVRVVQHVGKSILARQAKACGAAALSCKACGRLKDNMCTYTRTNLDICQFLVNALRHLIHACVEIICCQLNLLTQSALSGLKC